MYMKDIRIRTVGNMLFYVYQIGAALLQIFTEAAGYSQTSVTFYYHIRFGNPDDFRMINTCSKTLLTYIHV